MKTMLNIVFADDLTLALLCTKTYTGIVITKLDTCIGNGALSANHASAILHMQTWSSLCLLMT